MKLRKSNLVFFLSDFGTRDTYVSQVKAVILSISPQAHIVDITHNIQPQEVLEASFVLKSCYQYFPHRSIFLTVVDPDVGTKRKIIFAETHDYFFLAPDNGILYETLKRQKVMKIVDVENKKYFLKDVGLTFQARDIFAPVVGHFLKGKGLQDFGRSIKRIKRLEIPQPRIIKDRLKGRIMHIDHFGNIISNISKDVFSRFLQRGNFKGFLNGKEINLLQRNYQGSRRPFFIVGSSNFLEISLSSKSASYYFKARLYDEISIKRI